MQTPRPGHDLRHSRYGVGMSYTNAIRHALADMDEHSLVEIVRAARAVSDATYREAQRSLYELVKSGEVEWNRKMGNAGRYRLLSATVPPPVTGGHGRDNGTAAVRRAVMAARKLGTYAGLSDRDLRYLADFGLIGLNGRGKEWLQAREMKDSD